MAKRGEVIDLPPFGVSGDCVEGPAAGLGDEVAELVGAHADRGSEVVDEHDAPLGAAASSTNSCGHPQSHWPQKVAIGRRATTSTMVSLQWGWPGLLG